MCGEKCPDVAYCWTCAPSEKKDTIVDMLGLVKYADMHNLDEDPVILLPCGHFFAMSTLDGVMELGETGFVKLEHSFVTPRACPTCKAPIHGVHRYGPVQKVAELRLLERKHQKHTLQQFQDLLLVIADKKKTVAKPRTRNLLAALFKRRFGEARREACELDMMLGSMEGLLRCVGCGPMTMVNETLPVCERLRSAEQRIDMYQTEVLVQMGRSCIPHIRAVAQEDVVYRVARGALQAAMQITDMNGSHRSGAEARLLLVETFLADDRVIRYYWRFDEFLWEKELEANELCKWVIEHWSPGIGRRLKDEARELMARVADRERARVKRAADGWSTFGVTAGYSSNWYQCPNGHEYTIGNCGGPAQYGRCPECGALIGGVNHVLLSNNSRVRQL